MSLNLNSMLSFAHLWSHLHRKKYNFNSVIIKFLLVLNTNQLTYFSFQVNSDRSLSSGPRSNSPSSSRIPRRTSRAVPRPRNNPPRCLDPELQVSTRIHVVSLRKISRIDSLPARTNTNGTSSQVNLTSPTRRNVNKAHGSRKEVRKHSASVLVGKRIRTVAFLEVR